MSDADLTDPAVAADYDLVYTDWDEQVERLKGVMAGHLPVVSGGLLLDACCGSGISTEAAALLGWHVTALDASPATVAIARRRMPDADVRVGDLLAIEQATTNHFHAVTCVGNAPLRLGIQRLEQALRGVRARLRSDGTVMVAVRDLTHRPRSAIWRDDDVARVQARFADGPAGSLLYVLEVRDAAGFRSHELRLHPINALGLSEALEEAGFSVARTTTGGGRIVVSAHPA